jgi:hypothetical protein
LFRVRARRDAVALWGWLFRDRYVDEDVLQNGGLRLVRITRENVREIKAEAAEAVRNAKTAAAAAATRPGALPAAPATCPLSSAADAKPVGSARRGGGSEAKAQRLKGVAPAAGKAATSAAAAANEEEERKAGGEALNAIVMKALRAGAFIVVEELLDNITVRNQSTTEPSFFCFFRTALAHAPKDARNGSLRGIVRRPSVLRRDRISDRVLRFGPEGAAREVPPARPGRRRQADEPRQRGAHRQGGRGREEHQPQRVPQRVRSSASSSLAR